MPYLHKKLITAGTIKQNASHIETELPWMSALTKNTIPNADKMTPFIMEENLRGIISK